MAEAFFQPRCLLIGMHGGAHYHHAFAPYPGAAWRTTGPLKLIALGHQHRVPPVIGALYPY
jgi:hypothetical protein